MRGPFQDQAQQERYAEIISAQFLRGQSSEEDLQAELAGGFITQEQYEAMLNDGYEVGACERWDADNIVTS